MAPIKTYVFFDTETTGLIEGTDIPAITEVGMLAIGRRHFLASNLTEELNVDKFVMSFKPDKSLSREAIKLSGLSNELLADAADFNTEAFNAINSFINCLQKPVCLISHFGFRYHFRVIKYHFGRMGLEIADDVKCTDSQYAFYDLLEEEKRGEVIEREPNNGEEKTFEDLIRPRYFYPIPDTRENSYKLNEIYQRDIGADLLTNRAENHSTMMLLIAQKRAERFCKWVDVNNCPFSQVPTDML